MSALEVTSGAALSLRGGAPEREGGKQWGPHAGRPASGTGRGLPREGTACQVLLLSLGTGAFHGVSQLSGGEAWGWRPSCCSLGRTHGADSAGPVQF